MPALFHAVILAEGPHAACRVAGLTLRERAIRVAARAGAAQVHVIDGVGARATLGDRLRGIDAVLVIRASDQVVHTPLVAGLIGDSSAIAVAPVDPVASDVEPGAYAGALFAVGADVAVVIAALTTGGDDRAIAAHLQHARTVSHGPIARHPATTRDERRDAARLLYRIIHKAQDNAITRYLYRPVSFPLTRLFLHTPITPNQISYLTAVLVLLGLWFTARGSLRDAIIGTVIVLVASYVDCCDGEVARLKLLSSRFGAWLDTVIDELASFGYMIAIGWHCHLYFGRDYFGDLGFDPWIAAIWLGVVTFAISIYAVYYNIIVVVGSANSQDYVGRFEVVPGNGPNTVQLRPAASQPIATPRELPPVVRWFATYAPYIIRRDFISWVAVVLSVVGMTHWVFGALVFGGTGTAVIVSIDHVRLLRQRRAIVRSGRVLQIR